MTQKDKELLMKDLCARLPYGVFCDIYNEKCTITEKLLIGGLSHFCDDTIAVRPYLRPMSSMTEEEKEEMHNLLSPEGTAIYENNGISVPMNHYGDFVSYEFMNKIIQYLLKNHFDFMGLIPKSLAIEVTEENNPYKE